MANGDKKPEGWKERFSKFWNADLLSLKQFGLADNEPGESDDADDSDESGSDTKRRKRRKPDGTESPSGAGAGSGGAGTPTQAGAPTGPIQQVTQAISGQAGGGSSGSGGGGDTSGAVRGDGTVVQQPPGSDGSNT